MINAFRSGLVSWALVILVAWLAWTIVIAVRSGEANIMGLRPRRSSKPLRFWLAVGGECGALAACTGLLVAAIRQV